MGTSSPCGVVRAVTMVSLIAHTSVWWRYMDRVMYTLPITITTASKNSTAMANSWRNGAVLAQRMDSLMAHLVSPWTDREMSTLGMLAITASRSSTAMAS